MTILDIKNVVATQMGKTDGNVANTKRDTLINQARRKFYSERRWSFLFTSSTLTFTSKLADLPATYNKKFDPISIYTYISDVKYTYQKVEWQDVEQFTTESYVYAINKTTKQIKINQTTSSLTIDFTALPADAALDTTDDADVEPVDDITPIAYLAIAMYWLSSERSTGKFEMFMDMYRQELGQLISIDSAAQPVKTIRYLKGNRGYNKGSLPDPKGYIGQVGY